MFNYTEVLYYIAALLVQEESYKDSTGERHCAQEFEAVWYKNQGNFLYQFCAGPFEEEEKEDGEIGV